ncbi:glycerate kinase [Leifsonia shinshuensis]|uniref:glycerate kinase n=1 Tax=Leifsonia shinshuensis TaxID=150026 RepID=UPI0028572B60|nr:glycerate kinase [Leifsonia shinshuensis]MDR6973087.1 glycerate kinase [Leifsonia shinshuensis]
MSVVVVAPDSFKGSASAAEIAAALAAGWQDERPADRIVPVPMADGGEGTLDAFEAAVPGAVRHPVRVPGPTGEPVDATWLMLPGGTALVELAETSGLGRLTSPAPFAAHTVGFGLAIADALAADATGLLLAIGGSSSTDGGAGALTALGARFLDADGRDIPPGNAGLAAVATADLSRLAPLPPGGARILSDVTSPLLGPSGAAAVFGPQKGATEGDVPALEASLRRFAEVVGAAGATTDPDAPGAGAAGGTGFGLLLWGARMAPGAEAVGEALGLPATIASADVVITGEGRFDSQSASGKVPAYVSGLARRAGARVMLAAGSIQAPTHDFAAAVALADLAGSPSAAIADPARWARAAGAALARRL